MQAKNCKAKTQSGKPCRAKPLQGKSYCFTHEPSNAKQRAQARRKGGERTRTPHGASPDTLPAQVRTLADAQLILEYTLAEILPMENSIARARVLIALFDAFAKSIEIGEMQQRLDALEQALKAR